MKVFRKLLISAACIVGLSASAWAQTKPSAKPKSQQDPTKDPSLKCKKVAVRHETSITTQGGASVSGKATGMIVSGETTWNGSGTKTETSSYVTEQIVCVPKVIVQK